jgi:hypothetical protein
MVVVVPKRRKRRRTLIRLFLVAATGTAVADKQPCDMTKKPRQR